MTLAQVFLYEFCEMFKNTYLQDICKRQIRFRKYKFHLNNVRCCKVINQSIRREWAEKSPLQKTAPPLCLKLVSAIFHFFQRNNMFPGYFEQNTLKRNLIYSCFIFPLFHKHLFSPGPPRATRLLETSCFQKITVCVIETMLVTFPLVQMNKARREVSQQIKYKSTQDKIATVIRTYVFRMYLNDWNNNLPLFKLWFLVNQVVNLHTLIFFISIPLKRPYGRYA